MAKADLTAQRLRELVDYDPHTGAMTWKSAPYRNARFLGRQVGGIDKRSGYVATKIDNKSYRIHRLVWLYVHGVMPEFDVDHINGNRADNRLENLRLAPGSINQQNMRAAPKNSTTGILGVTYCRKSGRYHANIRVRRVAIFLGSFPSAEEASSAYLMAKRRLHEGCII